MVGCRGPPFPTSTVEVQSVHLLDSPSLSLCVWGSHRPKPDLQFRDSRPCSSVLLVPFLPPKSTDLRSQYRNTTRRPQRSGTSGPPPPPQSSRRASCFLLTVPTLLPRTGEMFREGRRGSSRSPVVTVVRPRRVGPDQVSHDRREKGSFPSLPPAPRYSHHFLQWTPLSDGTSLSQNV